MNNNDIHKKTRIDLPKEVRRLSDKNARLQRVVLQRVVDELGTLNDLSLAIGGSLDSEQIMRTIIGRSIRAIGAEQGGITLANTDPRLYDWHIAVIPVKSLN